MPRQEQLGLQRRRPTGFDKFQISSALASTVDFVADQRVSDVRRVDADLVGAPCPGLGPQKRELSLGALEPVQHGEFRDRLGTARIDASLQPDR